MRSAAPRCWDDRLSRRLARISANVTFCSAPDGIVERAAGVAEEIRDPVLEEDDRHDQEDSDARDQQRVLHKRLTLLALLQVDDRVLARHEEPEHYVSHFLPP